ncbi:MAG: hypothetical protein AAFO94_09100, partial [Bacteroidota bacterium]
MITKSITYQRPFIIVFLLCCSAYLAKAQKFKYSIPSLDTLSQDFVVGGVSTSLLQQGSFEYLINN